MLDTITTPFGNVTRRQLVILREALGLYSAANPVLLREDWLDVKRSLECVDAAQERLDRVAPIREVYA